LAVVIAISAAVAVVAVLAIPEVVQVSREGVGGRTESRLPSLEGALVDRDQQNHC